MPKSSGPTGGANDTPDVDPQVDPNQPDVTPDVTPTEPPAIESEPDTSAEKAERSGAYDLVRVRQGKREVSMTRIAAKRAGLTAIDGKPAADERGRPLAPKPVNDRADTTAQEA